MSKNKKFSPEEKVLYAQKYLSGESSMRSIANEIGISLASFRQWLRNYESLGLEGFVMKSNKKYSKDLKLQAIADYLSGLESQDDVCKKYGIRSKSRLQEWISMYNSHEDIKDSRTRGGSIMTKGRKTTYRERIEIVKYCIENQNDYNKTAKKFQVSYQQVYSWMSKYEKNGVEALNDRRGKRKEQTEMSELEKLKAQNKLLEAQNQRHKMEIEFLKKIEEIERRR